MTLDEELADEIVSAFISGGASHAREEAVRIIAEVRDAERARAHRPVPKQAVPLAAPEPPQQRADGTEFIRANALPTHFPLLSRGTWNAVLTRGELPSTTVGRARIVRLEDVRRFLSGRVGGPR